MDTLAAEVAQRLATTIEEKTAGLASKEDLEEARKAIPSQAEIEQMVSGYLEGEDGQEIIRKFRHEGTPGLKGSKYGRMGMSVSDIELTHDILVGAQAIGRSKGPSEDLRNAVTALSDRRVLTARQAEAEDRLKVEEMHRNGVLDTAGYRRAIQAIDQVYAAMDTAETGFGLELVGAQYVSELWRGAQARARVFSLINQFPMEDPTAYLPVEAGVPEMLFVGESTTSSASNYATSKTGSERVQVDAKKFVIHQMFSGEMEEDSIIPFVPFLQGQAARSVALHSDSLVLNGDTTNAGTGNINLDDADPADTKHYLAFDGIRHAALVDNTGNAEDQAGPIVYNKLIGARGLLLDTARDHDWGHPDEAEDLIYVSDPETGDEIALLDEVITVDKFGDRATVLTGQQGRIGLHPLISSIRMSKTEADGKVSTTGSNNTKGQVAVFNRTGFVVGVRRRLMFEVERLPGTDQTRLVWSERLGFGRYSPTGAAAGIEAAAVLYNISL
ncbi:MAG: hypothetical protein L0Z63_05770 [Actinobacteria bacterium]|nr:hypothetical protein [Actinomycetota bacterium]